MEGFKRGQEHRAWLDARGMERVQHIIVKNGTGDWRWELLAERVLQAQGSAKSAKLAYQACEDAAMDRLDKQSTNAEKPA